MGRPGWRGGRRLVGTFCLCQFVSCGVDWLCCWCVKGRLVSCKDGLGFCSLDAAGL